MPYVVVFSVFNDLMWKVFVRFVDIGGIVYHHCSLSDVHIARLVDITLGPQNTFQKTKDWAMVFLYGR